jgi:hypothetical protein
MSPGPHGGRPLDYVPAARRPPGRDRSSHCRHRDRANIGRLRRARFPAQRGRRGRLTPESGVRASLGLESNRHQLFLISFAI